MLYSTQERTSILKLTFFKFPNIPNNIHSTQTIFIQQTRPVPLPPPTLLGPRPFRCAPHVFKMASEDAREELTQMVRECVRNEIALQRSGSNTSLLTRTRDLIANSAQSASREVTNSITASSPAANLLGPYSTSTAAVSTPRFTMASGASNSFQPGAKRSSTSNTQHPWRFKKGKQKKSSSKQEFLPKAIHLLDKPEYQNHASYVPDYAVTDDMILLKGFFELGTGQSESEIRDSITDVLKQRFQFVRSDHFDFFKRERNSDNPSG